MHRESTDALSDEVIAERVQSGTVDDFGLLIDRYRPKMLRYARRFLADYDAVEDAVQEVFMKAYVNIQSSQKFSPWIYRIAHNTYINVIKKVGREPVSFFDADTIFQIPSSHRIEEDYARYEDAEELKQHLQNLDPKYREPLVLFYFEEKDYHEIADILHIPTSTVGVRMRRGREKIKQFMNTKNR